jgi:Fe-S cluster assembly protein SufD
MKPSANKNSGKEASKAMTSTIGGLDDCLDKAHISDNAPEWIKSLRDQTRTRLKGQALPSHKDERWRYSGLKIPLSVLEGGLSASDVSFTDPSGIVSKLMVSAAGEESWLKKIIQQAPVGKNRFGDMSLWDLCNALIRDGLVIDIPGGKVCEKPVEITITGHDGTFFVPRTVFRLGKNARATIIETHVGQGCYWNNRLTQIDLDEGAHLTHIRFQDNDLEAYYTQNTSVKVNRDACYNAFTLTRGAAFSRNQLHIDLDATDARTNISGVNLLKDKMVADTTINVAHNAPDCYSNQFVRSVLTGNARGVFQGKIHVQSEAQGTNGYQLSNALILSDTSVPWRYNRANG